MYRTLTFHVWYTPDWQGRISVPSNRPQKTLHEPPPQALKPVWDDLQKGLMNLGLLNDIPKEISITFRLPYGKKYAFTNMYYKAEKVIVHIYGERASHLWRASDVWDLGAFQSKVKQLGFQREIGGITLQPSISSRTKGIRSRN